MPRCSSPGPDTDDVALQAPTRCTSWASTAAPARAAWRSPSESPAGGRPPMVSRPLRLGVCLHAAWAGSHQGLLQRELRPGAGRAGRHHRARRRGVAARRRLAAHQPRPGRAQRPRRRRRVGPRQQADQDRQLGRPDPADRRPTTRTTRRTRTSSTRQSTSRRRPSPTTSRRGPGRTRKLHVLDNDTDVAGSVLAISPPTSPARPCRASTASVAGDGQAIDVSVPDKTRAPVVHVQLQGQQRQGQGQVARPR